MARDGWSVEQGIEKGRPEPSWWHEVVDRSPEADWLIQAFWNLSTCRSYGMGYGPIPWTAIKLYADEYELEPDYKSAFEAIIREMDSAYLTWHAAEQEQRRQSAANARPPRK